MIKANPTIITITRKAMVNDGFGGLMDDPTGGTFDYKFRVKISHQKSSVPSTSGAPIGLSTNMQKMITIDYKGGPIEGEQFTVANRTKLSSVQTAAYSGTVVVYNGDSVAVVVPIDSPSEVYTIGKLNALTEAGEIIGYQAALSQAGV
jgi:hypothetical protein